MQTARPLVQRLLAQTARRYHAEGGFRPASMDELPVPKGSWQAQYDRNQRKYNAALAFGIGFTIFTVVTAKASGLVYFNYSPPKSID